MGLLVRAKRDWVIVSAELDDKLLLLVLLAVLSFLPFTFLDPISGPIPAPFPKRPLPMEPDQDPDPDPSDGDP